MRFAGTKIANFMPQKPGFDNIGGQSTVAAAEEFGTASAANAMAAGAGLKAKAELESAKHWADAEVAAAGASAQAGVVGAAAQGFQGITSSLFKSGAFGGGGSGAGSGASFGINRGNSDTSNIAFTGYSGGDWNTGVSVSSYLDTWTHFSVSYDSGTVQMFLNGTSIGTASRTLNTGGSTFVVGGSEHSGNVERFEGKLQDVRVYNKKIRTANFTPPSAILS